MPLIVPRDASRFTIYKRYGVLVLSENMAAAYKPEPETVLIRIKEPGGFKVFPHEDLYVDTLRMVFDDVDQPSVYDRLMTEEQAVEIVDFMDKHRDKKLVVHCQAGISRSSATACAWAYMQGLPELEEEIRQNPCFYPNAHVYRLLVNEIDRRERLAI